MNHQLHNHTPITPEQAQAITMGVLDGPLVAADRGSSQDLPDGLTPVRVQYAGHALNSVTGQDEPLFRAFVRGEARELGTFYAAAFATLGKETSCLA